MTTGPLLAGTTRPGAHAAYAGLLRRRCQCGQRVQEGASCKVCGEAGRRLQRSGVLYDVARPDPVAPAIVGDVLRSTGQPLDDATREYFEPRLGHDLSRVRVHHDARASASATAVDALAYTVGRHIVFSGGQYTSANLAGRRLLAHELAHTIQQGHGSTSAAQLPAIGDPNSAAEVEADQAADAIERGSAAASIAGSSALRLARVCSSIGTCAAPIAGSAQDFGVQEQGREADPRTRRKRMTTARAVGTGHAGRALQLERFLNAHDPSRLPFIQGIFIDADMSSFTGALTQNCAHWIADSLPTGTPTPAGMAGATKDCTFVHGRLNQEALAFNTTSAQTIGGVSRERWRIDTLQTLVHETEHPRFEAATAASPLPPGVTSPTCARANVLTELSELAAGLSEFPTISRAASAEANPAGPRHIQLTTWVRDVAHNADESFSGALTKMGCSCECAEVDAHSRAVFDEVTASNGWSAGERTAFNTRMRAELPVGTRPSWPL